MLIKHLRMYLLESQLWLNVQTKLSIKGLSDERIVTLTLWARQPYIYGQRVIQFRGDRIYMVELSTRSLPDVAVSN